MPSGKENDSGGPPRAVFDPDNPEHRGQMAAGAYERSLQVAAARASERGEDGPRYALAWRHLPPETQEPFRAAVDALISIIELQQERPDGDE